MIEAHSRSFGELVGGLPLYQPGSEVHGTTVLALRFKGGALVLADRRATMGNLIMFEKAEKIEQLDPWTVVAISGAYARSLEICRYLKHSFKYSERLNQQEFSTEAKLMEISRALSGNMAMAAEGAVFLPIAAAYDKKRKSFGVYFFDGAGARFQDSDYACAGSGSERIRGIFEYLIRTAGPWSDRSREEVLKEALRILDIAASLDSATGGFRKGLPLVTELTPEGAVALSEEEIRSVAAQVLGEFQPLR